MGENHIGEDCTGLVSCRWLFRRRLARSSPGNARIGTSASEARPLQWQRIPLFAMRPNSSDAPRWQRRSFRQSIALRLGIAVAS